MALLEALIDDLATILGRRPATLAALLALACNPLAKPASVQDRPACFADADCLAATKCWKEPTAPSGFCDTDGDHNGMADLTDAKLAPVVRPANCTADGCKAGAKCVIAVNRCLFPGQQGAGDGCDDATNCVQGLLCNTKSKCADGGQGAPCDQAGDCTSTFCQHTSTAAIGACGNGAAGEPCVAPQECNAMPCNPLGYCGGTKDGGPCAAGTDCATGFCNGMNACGKAPAGAACSAAGDCQSGYCGRKVLGVAGLCGSGAAADPCVADADCQAGLGCNSSHYCGPLTGGEPCLSSKECPTGFCNSKAKCGQVSDGEACSVPGDCKSGFCSWKATCGKLADGESCATSADCEAGHCNSFASCGVVANGQPCKLGPDCKSTYCQMLSDASVGKCGDGKPGEPCGAATQCSGNYCNSGGTCGKLDAGAPCTVTADCVSGGCVQPDFPKPGLCGTPCDPSKCDDSNPCTADGCSAGEMCQNKVLADGSACGSAMACKAGMCVKTCTPGFAHCSGNSVATCALDGMSTTTTATCGPGQYCSDNGNGAAACLAQVCLPNGVQCDGNSIVTCNSVGSGYVAGAVPCGALGKVCVAGTCATNCGAGYVLSATKTGDVCAPDAPVWGIGPLSPDSLVASGEDTVLDGFTKLIWQKGSSPTTMGRMEAAAYCQSQTTGGKTDWRLPTVAELQSIADYEKQNPAISAVFSAAPAEWFWTTVPYKGAPDTWWGVRFTYGNSYFAVAATKQRVRCVRGQALGALPADRFVVNSGQGIVVDNLTKLTWQLGLDAQTLTAADAKTYCANLGLAGGGWRLPSVREMQSVVDRAVVQPAIDLKVFASTPNTYFWTSTPWMGGGQTWFVYFDDGHAKHDYSFATYRVRCVR